MIKHKMKSGVTKPSNILIAVAVIAFAGAVGAGVWLYSRQAEAPSQYQGQALKDAVDKSNASGDYGQTARLIEGQKVQTYDSRIQLAVAYLNDTQYDKALDVLDQLDKQGRLIPAHSILAGNIAEQKGDKKLALTYYRQAKSRLDPQAGSGARRQLRECDRKITELEAAA